jgi:hypothetical protein
MPVLNVKEVDPLAKDLGFVIRLDSQTLPCVQPTQPPLQLVHNNLVHCEPPLPRVPGSTVHSTSLSMNRRLDEGQVRWSLALIRRPFLKSALECRLRLWVIQDRGGQGGTFPYPQHPETGHDSTRDPEPASRSSSYVVSRSEAWRSNTAGRLPELAADLVRRRVAVRFRRGVVGVGRNSIFVP